MDTAPQASSLSKLPYVWRSAALEHKALLAFSLVAVLYGYVMLVGPEAWQWAYEPFTGDTMMTNVYLWALIMGPYFLYYRPDRAGTMMAMFMVMGAFFGWIEFASHDFGHAPMNAYYASIPGAKPDPLYWVVGIAVPLLWAVMALVPNLRGHYANASSTAM
ncbi:MAG: hypothetical protein AAGI71_08030 [Bacteroidota bacterium]